jgi:hypothetical protein
VLVIPEGVDLSQRYLTVVVQDELAICKDCGELRQGDYIPRNFLHLYKDKAVLPVELLASGRKRGGDRSEGGMARKG